MSRVYRSFRSVSAKGRLAATLPILLVVAGFAGAPAGATDRFVANKGNDTGNDCATSATPCATLDHAIAVAGAGSDEIKLAGGRFSEQFAKTIDYPATLVLTGGWSADFSSRDVQKPTKMKPFSLRLDGTNAAVAVTIDGFTLGALTFSGQSQPVVAVLNGDIDLTVQSSRLMARAGPAIGNSPGFGFGGPGAGSIAIHLFGSRLDHSDEAINLDTSGSASVTITIDGSSIDHNRHGLFLNPGGSSSITTNVTNSVVEQNADAGYRLREISGNQGTQVLTVDRSRFSKNRSGAITMRLGGSSTNNGVTIQSSTFTGNSSGNTLDVAGGGPAQLTVENSVFAGNVNTSRSAGCGPCETGNGAIAVRTGPLQGTIRNTTIVGNRGADGGGISLTGSFGGPQVLDLIDTIVWGNSSSVPGRDIFLYDFNTNPVTVNLDHSDVGEVVGTTPNDLGGNISVDPQVVNRKRDGHLMAASPCIDTGTCLGAPATDIDGDPRPTGAGCDMGADEFVP